MISISSIVGHDDSDESTDMDESAATARPMMRLQPATKHDDQIHPRNTMSGDDTSQAVSAITIDGGAAEASAAVFGVNSVRTKQSGHGAASDSDSVPHNTAGSQDNGSRVEDLRQAPSPKPQPHPINTYSTVALLSPVPPSGTPSHFRSNR